MSEHPARLARDVYDFEDDEPRAGGRRRRPVADWGVDDVFDHMPRRRFGHAGEGPARERRVAHADDRRPRAQDEAAQAEGWAGEARVDVPRGHVDDGRRTIVIGRDEHLPSEIAAITADRDLGDDDAPVDAPVAARSEPSRTGPHPERRTVRIGGRPEGSLEAARYRRDLQRRRPPRTAHERLGARPDRLAAWAVALGMLLILIAILTAH